MISNVTFFTIFNLFIGFLLFLDLKVFNAKNQPISTKKSLILCGFWVSLALLFCLGIYWFRGEEDALNFLTGYIIELSLSIDNLFVFILIFNSFNVPKHLIHKTLFWGIIGAITMRALFIIIGIVLIQSLHWMFYIFGLFLIYSGVNLILKNEEEEDFNQKWIVKALKKFIPMTSTYTDHFFTHIDGKLFATPLFLVLILVEMTDVVFSLDSIPAILGITQDPMIVFSSNIFAILGLRTMYFALSGIMELFHHLHYGLAFILIFIGLKMLIEGWVHIPILLSLGFIVSAITISIIASLLTLKKK